MKYKLQLDKLWPGDIILAGYTTPLSRKIQERTNSRYSHAMLYGYGFIIHAADLVITQNPSRLLFEKEDAVCVLRLKDAPGNDLRIKDIIDYSRQFVGTLYDLKAVVALNRNETPVYNPNRQMCSKFIAQCFEYICSDLVEDYESCSPQDLYESPQIDIIEDILVEADEWDEKFVNSDDVTRVQYDTIFNIIKRLLKKYPDADIMSLKQLDIFIEKNPEESNSILELMQEAGYFRLWEIEKEYCPYLYDEKQFKDFFGEKFLSHAVDVKVSSEKIIAEKQELAKYYQMQIQKVGNLKYYNEMILLIDNIISNAIKRIEIATQILSDNRVVRFFLNY